MRRNFSVAVGALVILAGVSLLLRVVFHIHLPLVPAAFGFLLIYLGAHLVLGSRFARRPSNTTTVFGERSFAPAGANPPAKYDIIFGRGTVDLTGVHPTAADVPVEINVVFGAAVVLLDAATPLQLEASSVFGVARTPDHQAVSFGTLHSGPRGQPPGAAALHLRVNVVFGSAELRESGDVQHSTGLGAPAPRPMS
jgi:hypothetical protein